MLLTWTSLVRNALSRKLRRPFRRCNWPALVWQVETLEARLLLTTAVNDSYNVTHDHTLSGQNVIANDIHGGPLMNPSLVSGVSHGGLTFNSDGSFSYVPNTHYVGSDSFTYKDWDGFSWSNTATVSIAVNNSAPSAANDSYTVYTNNLDSAAAGAASLLANDTDADSDTLTASLVTAPSHGTLTVNADGSFVYTKTAGYFGSDSAVYAASDGIASTNATISFNDTSPFSAQTNAPDQPFAGILSQGAFSTSQLTGEAQAGFALGQGHDLAYSSLTSDVKPIIAVETTYQGSGVVPTPDSIDVSLTFGGVTAPTLYFNNAGLTPGDTVRFAQQVDASSLATGHYQYTMTLTSHYGSATSTRTFTGYQDIVNRESSEFGPGWSLAELDKLAVGTGGVLWAGGAGGTAWFTDTGSGTYSSPAGPMAFSTLAKSGSNYTLTDKFGNVENFDSTGLLTSRVDANGNTTSYAYSSGKLSTITDPFGRTTTFNYTSGLVTSVTDIASRTTTLAYTSGNLTSVTAPDPDGAGPLSAPVTAYAYSANRLSSITDPLSHVTSLTYNFAGRLSGATFPDSATASFTAAEMQGMIDTSGGVGASSGNPASAFVAAHAQSSYTDELSHSSSGQFDVFGDALSSTDALSMTTTYVRDANGLITQMTQSSPATGVSAPVTSYTYDSKGNLTKITYPDSSYETWTYDATFNKPLTHTDQLGHTTTYTLDSHGNVLTVTDRLGNVTTYAYNSHGEVTSITTPNPSTGSSTGGAVTSFTIDSDGRVTRVTNPDTTHKDFTYDSADNLLTSTDELGRVTTNTYDNLDRKISVTLPNASTGGGTGGPQTTFAYNAAGLLTSQTDALGYSTVYAYNSRNWLTSVTAPDPDGSGPLTASVTSFGYNAGGERTTVTDALGNVTTTAYDADGRVTSVTAPVPATGVSAPVTSYSYDNLGRTTAVTDPNSHTTSYAYNSLNQVTSKTDALSNITSYTYDALGDVLTVTAPNASTGGATGGPVTTMTYDNEQKLVTTTDAMSNVTTDAYDHLGRLTSVTQPNPSTGGSTGGPVTSYAYDSMNRKTSETNALGYATTYAYDNASELTSVALPNPTGGTGAGPTTSYQYDGDGRLTVTTDPLSHTTSQSYDADGNVLTTTDSLSNVTTNAYDHDGRLVTVTSPTPTGGSAEVTTYAYNADNQVTTRTNAASGVHTNAYDNDGRLISQTDELSRETQYGYDAAGNLTTTTDNLGHVTTDAYNADNWRTSETAPVPATGVSAPVNSYGYDHLGRETTSTDPDGGVTHYAYNADGVMTSVQDPASNTTSFAFDHLNRETSTTDANSHTASFTLDAIGEMTSKTDKDGRVTNYTFDHDGRLTEEDWMSGGTAIYSAIYAYNAASDLTSASDNFSAYAYAYNGNDQVTSVDNNGTPNVPRVVLALSYDSLTLLSSESATVAGTNDFLNNYSYDALNRLTRVTQAQQTGGNTVAAKRVDFAYNADGQYTSISRYADTTGTNLVATSTYGYNGVGSITSLSYDKGGTNFASYTWSYDNDQRLTSDSLPDGTDSYTYDAASQITAATHSYQTNESYSYDSNGNRTNTGYSTGTNNQLSSDGTYNYTYDNAGNLTQKTAITGGAYTTYTWDYHNRLTDVQNYTSASVLTQHVHYTYDVYDRLIGKQLDPTGGGTYTSAQRFVYDSAASPPSQGGVGGVTSNGNIALVFNSSGTLTDRFLNGPNENQTLADEKSGTINWYFTDNQGTVRDVAQYNSGTNTTSVVDHLKLDSFGNITAQSNSANQPLFAFTGQLFDAATGLYYDHARWYDPRTGRFVSQDPMGFAAGDANLYRYVGNSPANFTDPTGMEESGPNSVGAQAAQQAAEKEKEAAAEEGTEAAEAAKTATESYIEATDRMIERVNKMMLDFQNDRLKNIAERAKDLKAEKEKAESQHKLSAKEIAYFNEKVAALNRSRALAMGDANAAQAAVGHLAQGGNGALLGVLSPETGSSPVGWLGLSPGGMFGPKGDPESAKIVVGFTKVFDLGNGFILNVNTSLNISIFGGKTDETNTVNLGFSY